MTTPLRPRGGVLSRFFGGVLMLFRGFRLWGTSPKLMLLGAIPAIIVGIVYTILVLMLLLNIGQIATWTTPFAANWEEPLRTLTRTIAALAFVFATGLFIVLSFATITLLVGDPFYERISHKVWSIDDKAALVSNEGIWLSVVRGIGQSLRMLLTTILIGLALFVAGFLPLVGQSIVPVVAVLVGGWFLTVELTGFAFEARGLHLRDRRRMLARDRAGAVGFGVASYLLLLVPFAAIVVMPVAVAGATIFAQKVMVKL